MSLSPTNELELTDDGDIFLIIEEVLEELILLPLNDVAGKGLEVIVKSKVWSIISEEKASTK